MNDLLGVLTLSSSVPVEHKSAADGASGFDGLAAAAAAGAGPRAVPHPVVAAMNGATASMLLRLKHAAMFEDFQVTGRGSRWQGWGWGWVCSQSPVSGPCCLICA